LSFFCDIDLRDMRRAFVTSTRHNFYDLRLRWKEAVRRVAHQCAVSLHRGWNLRSRLGEDATELERMSLLLRACHRELRSVQCGVGSYSLLPLQSPVRCFHEP
jgi:hypothetical protein